MQDCLGRLAGPEPARLLTFCAAVRDMPVLDVAARYVSTFDRSRRRTLHLPPTPTATPGAAGPARRVEGSLPPARLAAARRRTPRPPAARPVALEFAARCPGPGTLLLAEHRPGLDLMAAALTAHGSPYTDVLHAVCATLPASASAPPPAGRETAARRQAAHPAHPAGQESGGTNR